MLAFRTLLGVMFAVVLVYSGMVGAAHGWDVLPIFFADIAALTWPGQFNLDFACFLILSGLWVAWRHHFAPAGLALGLVVALVGIVVFAPYLLFASIQAKGSAKVLMLGDERAASRGLRD